MNEFRNESGLDFKSIESEEWREYLFDTGLHVRIEQPVALHVSASGGHRVFDGQGKSHYIPSGWIHLCWRAKDGSPHFVL